MSVEDTLSLRSKGLSDRAAMSCLVHLQNREGTEDTCHIPDEKARFVERKA